MDKQQVALKRAKPNGVLLTFTRGIALMAAKRYAPAVANSVLHDNKAILMTTTKTNKACDFLFHLVATVALFCVVFEIFTT